jgi:hypothetical protein
MLTTQVAGVRVQVFFFLALEDKVASIPLESEEDVRALWRILYANHYVADKTKGGVWAGPDAHRAKFYAPIN